MSPRPRNSEATAKRRSEIISAAAQLFNTAGYHQTSMDDIAEKMGLAKPTLYHYYAGKAQILAAIHEEFIVAMAERFHNRQTLGLSPNDQLCEVMVDILEFIAERRGHVKVFYEHQQDLPTESRAHITRLRTEFTGKVSQLISECIDRGEFREVDPRMAARALLGTCNWSVHWFRPSKATDARDTAVFMHAMLTQGLSVPELAAGSNVRTNMTSTTERSKGRTA
jgi:AcrR family transcriptional regulator